MRSIPIVLCLLLAGCGGVPKSQYDAAVAEARDARADRDQRVSAMQKQIDELEAKLQAARSAPGENAEELAELRRQKAAAEARLELFEDFLAKFKQMIEAGKLEITVRRGQIVLALGTDILFDTGKAEIKPEGKAALGEIAHALKGVAGRRFQVAGHTDSVPIKSAGVKAEFRSNWELSTARAVAVVKLLIEKGVRPGVLSAAGYAEFDPAKSNATPAGREKNRRIEITLVPNIEELVKLPGVGKQESAGEPDAAEPAVPGAGKPKTQPSGPKKK